MAEQIHHFDAEDLGCAEGLPAEWKKQLDGIPVGDVLETVARDPSAREDLPALARMLGHEVISSDWGPDASVIVSVRRAKEGT